MKKTCLFPKNRHNLKRGIRIKSSCFGILLVCLAVHSGCSGQEYLEKKIINDSLLEKTIHLRKIKNDSILKLFELNKKNKYLTLLPNISYDALNNSFNVGISFSNFANYFQQQKRNKIELARLEQSLNDKLSDDLDKLNILIENFKIELNSLISESALFKIDASLFEITKGKYENNEITTEDFLKRKKVFFQKNII